MTDNKQIDLLILDSMYFKKRMLETRLSINQMYFNNGIFDSIIYDKHKSNLNREINLINSDMNYKKYLLKISSTAIENYEGVI